MEDRDVPLAELLSEVRRIEVQSKRLVNGLMAGAYHSVFRGSGIEFDELREYVDGDDPRAVDWAMTARVGRPFVKTYVEERELTVLFLLDVSASMDGGFGVWSARQTAARVCACLALAAVRNGDKVGSIAFSAGVDRHVPPRKGVAHALRVVRDALALGGGAGSPTGTSDALRYATRVVRRRAIVFVLSDFLDVELGDALSRCARRHDVIAVRILLPELADPGERITRVRDPEGGGVTTVDWTSRAVREAYSERVRAWRRRTDDELRRAGVDWIDVPVPRTRESGAVVRPILDFFRVRERRRTKG